MKQRIWKHACAADTVREYLLEKTGHTFEELSANVGHFFKRFPEVKRVLEEAARTKRVVYLVGDYDSDGINAVMIMTLLFLIMGINFGLIIPKREAEGYGLSQKIIDRIEDGAILITIDNGITAIEQMKEAKKRGMYTIILDHHTADDVLPDVDILIDPSAIGEADYTHYCGAGIGYRLAQYILGEDHPIMPSLSVFAAIATIGDVVELTGDNRQIVLEGMKNAKEFKGTAAMNALLAQKEVKFTESTTSTDLAFNVVPILNAPERLEDGGAAKVCNILLKKANFDEGIQWLIQTNQKRKDLVSRIIKETESKADMSGSVIVYANQNIPLGIAGIIAGDFSQKAGKPAFIFGMDTEGNFKGSARCNVPGMNIINLIRNHKDLLLGCGGHAGAAGLSISPDKIDAFRQAMEKEVSDDIQRLIAEGVNVSDNTEYSCWDVQANDLNVKRVCQEILALEPCGCGMPAPKLRIKSRLLKVDRLGGEKDSPDDSKPHVKFTFSSFTAIGFNQNDWYVEQCKLLGKEPRYADIIGTVTDNVYKGNHSLQIRMDDFEIS